MAQQEWTLKRNCSISPRQLAMFYASICAVSLLLACVFTFHGAWLVLVFACIELSAVGLAFLYYARHAGDRERILLQDDCLMVELIESERCQQYRFDTHSLRVEAPEQRGLVLLHGGSRRLGVGRFLTQFKRREFALELRSALIAQR